MLKEEISEEIWNLERKGKELYKLRSKMNHFIKDNRRQLHSVRRGVKMSLERRMEVYENIKSNNMRIDMYNLEEEIVWLNYQEGLKRCKRITMEAREMLRVTKKNTASIKVNEKKRIELEKERCSICLEKHGIKNQVITNCGHTFGIECFSNYLEKKQYSCATCLSCPMCRKEEVEVYNIVKK